MFVSFFSIFSTTVTRHPSLLRTVPSLSHLSCAAMEKSKFIDLFQFYEGSIKGVPVFAQCNPQSRESILKISNFRPCECKLQLQMSRLSLRYRPVLPFSDMAPLRYPNCFSQSVLKWENLVSLTKTLYCKLFLYQNSR